MGWLYSMWRRRAADVIGALLVIVVAGGAATAFVLQSPNDELPATRALSVAKLPACREVQRPLAPDGRARCRDGAAAVELFGAKAQIVLDGFEVRVLGVERQGRAVRVLLRFGNRSTATRVMRDNDRQIYVEGAGRRVYGRTGRTLSIKRNSEVAATYRFEDVGATGRPARGAWLGVVPFAELARAHPSRVGAIQLELPANGGTGDVVNAPRRQGAATQRDAASAAHREQSRGAHGSRRRVRLTLVATGPVYVCVRAGQRVLVPGRMLQSGDQAGPFRATSFTMTLGSTAIRMRLDGRPPVAPTASPSGYVVDRRGARALPSGRLPTCGD
jgi:hypothetical protein